MGKVLDDSAECVIVICDIRGSRGITMFRAGLRRVIHREMDKEQLGQVPARNTVKTLYLRNELIGTELIRDVRIEIRVIARSVFVEYLRHRHVRQVATTRGLETRPLIHSGELETFPEVPEGDSMSAEI